MYRISLKIRGKSLSALHIAYFFLYASRKIVCHKRTRIRITENVVLSDYFNFKRGMHLYESYGSPIISNKVPKKHQNHIVRTP